MFSESNQEFLAKKKEINIVSKVRVLCAQNKDTVEILREILNFLHTLKSTQSVGENFGNFDIGSHSFILLRDKGQYELVAGGNNLQENQRLLKQAKSHDIPYSKGEKHKRH